MGWSSGTELAERLEKILDRELDFGTKRRVGRKIAAAFEDFDADSLEECPGFIGNAANRMCHESMGAPQDPNLADRYTDRCGDRHLFNGSRWVHLQDDE